MSDSGHPSSRNPVLTPLALARVLLSAAVVLSTWVGWQSLQHAPGMIAGCGVGSGCDTVLGSDWAWVGPVPTAWVGAAFYLMQIILLGSHSSVRRVLIYLLSGNIAAALFFIGVQALLLGAWCPWCCSIHLLATAGAACGIVSVWRRRSQHPSTSIRAVAVTPSVAWSTLAHLLFLGVFSGVMLTAKSEEKTGMPTAKAPPQAKIAPLTTSESDGKRWLSLHGERFRFELETLPRLGTTSAKHLIVCITDPSCHHCRNTSELLSEAWKSQKEGEVAIVFLPGTRDPELSPALQIALLTLWQEKPQAWADLSARLHRSDLAPTLEAVTEAARLALGGKTKWNAALEKHRNWAGQMIQQTSELMAENARVAGREVTLPQLQFQSQILLGAPSGVQDLVSLTGATVPWSMDLRFEDPADLSSSPCKNRQFCQRLVLILTGNGRDNVVPGPLNLDRYGHSALDDAKILSQSGPNQNPPLVYVFSGYEELAKAVSALKSDRIKLFTSSHDDWSRFLERLPLELEPLLQNTRCAAMIQSRLQDFMSAAEKLAVLSEFISVEVSVYGHSSSIFSPAKKRDQTHGLAFAPSTRDQSDNIVYVDRGTDPDAFDNLDFGQMKAILPHAVYRGLTTTCNGTEVVKFLEPSSGSECACFLSASGATTVAISWQNRSPIGLHSLTRDFNKMVNTVFPSLSRVKDGLYDPYIARTSPYVLGDYTPTGIGSSNLTERDYGELSYVDAIYALYDTTQYLTLPLNPLSGLVVSSADLSAASALKMLSEYGESDAALAKAVAESGGVSQLRDAFAQVHEPQAKAELRGILEAASAKAEKFISPQGYVTAKTAREYTDYGAYYLTRLFSSGSDRSDWKPIERAFVESVREAEAYYKLTKDSLMVSANMAKFFEMFDPESENYFDEIKTFGPKADAKLRVYWSRMDSMRQTLSSYYQWSYRSGVLSEEKYNELLKSLQETMVTFNAALGGYVAARAAHLKKDAFITNEVKVMMALKLLSNRVKSSEVVKMPASTEVMSAYSRLLCKRHTRPPMMPLASYRR